MSTMQIAVFPLDTERAQGIRDLTMSLRLLSKERKANCKLTLTGAIITADKETLLEILDELDSVSFRKVAKKVAITINFDESHSKTVIPDQIGVVEERMVEESSIDNPYYEDLSQKTLYDLVERRLANYIRTEEEVLI